MIASPEKLRTPGRISQRQARSSDPERHRSALEADREELADLFRQLGFLEPDGIDAYFRAATLYRDLRARGVTVRSTIDCLIAVLAEAHGCHLLARDRDLARILESGLVAVRPWPPAPPSPGVPGEDLGPDEEPSQ
jgi:predicted nucleic acid-binding protein